MINQLFAKDGISDTKNFKGEQRKMQENKTIEIYRNIIEIIIDRLTEEIDRERIYAYMDIAQIIRDELEREYKRNSKNNSAAPGDGKSAAETEV